MSQSITTKLSQIINTLIEQVKKPQFYGYLIGVAVAAIVSMAFFYPDAVEGNQLHQADMQQGAAIGQEAKAYVEATGAEQPRWTNSLFSGMPTFQISPSYPSDHLFRWINTLYGGFLPSPANLLFMMMVGFLILMAALGVRWYYGIIGALAWGLSSYFVIIIGAGHIWKFVTLAYIPPTIAGLMLAYRGRPLMGSALAALFAMLQIYNNHVQMTYYFLMVIIALVVAYLIEALKAQGGMKRWLRATAMLAAGAALAIGANSPNLYNTYKYSKESMRGSHSELTSADPGAAKEKTSGLDRDYITQYSYGRAETLTLLIPDVKGGASVLPGNGGLRPATLGTLPKAYETASKYNLNEGERQYLTNYVSQYFGEPESTNGPVYVGAAVMLLFLLGCMIVKGPVKWALVVMTLLSLLLALGRNLQWLTDLFIDYVPMYAKFRTVESILVVAEFTIPLLAILALQKMLTTQGAWKQYHRQLYWATALTGGICLIGWLSPGIFGPAISQGDVQISQMIGYQLQMAGYPAEALRMFSIDNPAIASAVAELRMEMVKADSMRSLIFIVLCAILLWAGSTGRTKAWLSAAGIGVLILIDLYGVDKRYLNTESFSSPTPAATDFPLTAADREILADTTMNYRVMDIPQFYQAAPSYHHKAVGGYHAAKLTRYQDLIDHHLNHFTQNNATEADIEVLNMLNVKYIIDNSGEVIENPGALGNAWFIDSITYVATPDEEMAALSTLRPATHAVADRRFATILGETSSTHTPGDTIVETSYAPDRLTYISNSRKGGIAVFSEVFFPWGWELLIDGEPAEIGRVNYLLRAVRVPAGTHTIEMSFRPRSVSTTVAIARVCIWAIYLLLITATIISLLRKKPLINESAEETDR